MDALVRSRVEVVHSETTAYEIRAPTTSQKQPPFQFNPRVGRTQSHKTMPKKKRKRAGPALDHERVTADAVPDRVVATRLGPLHDGHPLVIVAEERQVEVGAAAVGLGADGELAQQPAHSLGVPSILGVHNSVFKPERKHQ